MDNLPTKSNQNPSHRRRSRREPLRIAQGKSAAADAALGLQPTDLISPVGATEFPRSIFGKAPCPIHSVAAATEWVGNLQPDRAPSSRPQSVHACKRFS
jgi:hypothetical protein